MSAAFRLLCKSEIEQLRSSLGDHDVRRFHVPIRDPIPVRLVQRVGDLACITERLIERQRPFTSRSAGLPSTYSITRKSISFFTTNVMKHTDARMIQARNCFRFPLKPLAKLGTFRKMSRQDLDRDSPIQPGVVRAIYFAHASGANGTEDFIRT